MTRLLGGNPACPRPAAYSLPSRQRPRTRGRRMAEPAPGQRFRADEPMRDRTGKPCPALEEAACRRDTEAVAHPGRGIRLPHGATTRARSPAGAGPHVVAPALSQAGQQPRSAGRVGLVQEGEQRSPELRPSAHRPVGRGLVGSRLDGHFVSGEARRSDYSLLPWNDRGPSSSSCRLDDR